MQEGEFGVLNDPDDGPAAAALLHPGADFVMICRFDCLTMALSYVARSVVFWVSLRFVASSLP